jgi:hypothetical protein
MKEEVKHGGTGKEENDDSTIPLVCIFKCFVYFFLLINLYNFKQKFEESSKEGKSSLRSYESFQISLVQGH